MEHNIEKDDSESCCPICRNKLSEVCLECAKNGESPEQCATVRGKCGHRFHLHCIQKWLKVSKQCPVPGDSYEFQIDES